MLCGVINLLEWFRSPELNQTIFNYATSENKAHLAKVVEVYGTACRFFNFTMYGKFFLESELKNKKSFLNLINGLNDKVKFHEDLHTQFAIILRDDLIDQNKATAAGMTTRKAEQAFVNILDTSGPTIGKIFGGKVLAKLGKRLGEILTQSTILTKKIKPLDGVNITFDAIDETSIKSFLDSKGLKGLIAIFELYNLTIAIKTLQDDPKNSINNIFGIVGASADLVSENYPWLLDASNRYLKSSKLTNLIATKISITGPLMVISGLIDCMVGYDSSVDAYNRGEFNLCQAYVTYSIGGGLIALGAATMLAGGETAVVSVGTASVPAAAMVSAGIVTSLLGLAFQYWWDDEQMKKWLEKCIFGDTPQILKSDFFKEEKLSSSSQINGTILNDLDLTKTEPLIKLEIKQMNTIMFNFFTGGAVIQEENGDRRTMWSSNNLQEKNPGLSADQIASIQAKINQHRLPKKYTMVHVNIEPGLITPDAEITFSNVKKYSINRMLEKMDFTQANNEDEYVKPVANSSFSMTPFSSNKTKLTNIKRNKDVLVENDVQGRVIKISKTFIFENEDIDKLTGQITIDFKRKSQQIITKEFVIEI